VERKAGEEWLLPGPCVFHPQPFVSVVDSVAPTIIPPSCALRLRAKRVRRTGPCRVCTSLLGCVCVCWAASVRPLSVYFLSSVIVISLLEPCPRPTICSPARQSFTDGKETRAAGEEWLHCKPGAYVRRVHEEVRCACQDACARCIGLM
jgi:hypothetical protein